MDETLYLFQKNINHDRLKSLCNSTNKPLSQRSDNPKRRKLNIEVTTKHCAGLVDNGKRIILSHLKKARDHVRKICKAHDQSDHSEAQKLKLLMISVDKNSRDLVQDIGEEESRILHRLLMELESGNHNRSGQFADRSILRVASCYVSGTTALSLNDYNSERNEIVVPKNSSHHSQRII